MLSNPAWYNEPTFTQTMKEQHQKLFEEQEYYLAP